MCQIVKDKVRMFVKHPTAQAFHYVEYPYQLRAFIENPLHEESEPFLLCEVENTCAVSKVAQLRQVGTLYTYNQKFENIKCVHIYVPTLDKVVKILGDVKAGN